MTECVFCKIVSGEIQAAKIWEDSEFLAILDANPNTLGMTLVLTKKHFDSYTFEMPDDVFERFCLTAKKIGKLLDEKLGVQRTALVMEGMGINHAHVKLYPLHGLSKEFKSIWAAERKYYENYVGFLTTKMGPPADANELNELAKKIRE